MWGMKGFHFMAPEIKTKELTQILIYSGLSWTFAAILIIEFICLSLAQATQINHITVFFPVGRFPFNFVASV